MHSRDNISYLIPRDPSIKCWSDRVKLPGPCTKNLIQLGTDEFEETMGDNIKIYLRLKPSVCVENPYTVLSSTTLQTEAPKESVSYKNVTNGVGKLIHKFTFTSILDQDTTQAELFKKSAVKNLKAFLSGKNYLLMAYGTTSAGKTHTMQGNVEQPGVIPRALDFLFTTLKDRIIPICRYTPCRYNELLVLSEEKSRKDLIHKNFILSLDLSKYQRYPDVTHITLQSNSSSGFSDSYENVTFKEMKSHLVDTENFEVTSDAHGYSVWVSMIEIYNEQVYDLLDLPNEKGQKPKLAFRDDDSGNTFVKNLRYVNVSTGHEAFQILQFGRNNLHFAPTALNLRSSRSHCIFTVTLAKFLDYDSTSHAVISRFSFCDLAGMERAKKTLNVKDRLIESKAINTSLSILVKCLTTIKENQNSKEKKMIPYRESKLTKLFRDAVTGKEQFSLIVNVTTEPNLFDETLNVLKFSAIAQKIVPQNVFARPKMAKMVKRSRFSRIVSSSSNSRIIDWDSSANVKDVTDVKAKEESSISDEEVTELRDLVESLRAQLAQERKRCEQIEMDIREELTSKFSEMLKKLNESNRIRLENETESIHEMYEKKQRRLVHYYELMGKMKRPKLDDDLSDFEDKETRLKEVENELELLKAENESLKEQVQGMLGERQRLTSECSKLRFKLVEKERTVEALQKANKANEEGGDELEKELRKQLNEANEKIDNFKSLLAEAAVDFKEAEENNKFLRNENKVLEQQLAEQLETVNDVKNENSELEKILSQKRIMMEKLEEANEALREGSKQEQREGEEEKQTGVICQKEVEILREQLKKTSEWLTRSREECEEVRGEKADLEKDLEVAKLKMEDLERKVEERKRREEAEAERTKEVEKEKGVLEEKCKELADEVKSLQKEVKVLLGASKKESERLEVEALTKENDSYQKELLRLKKRNSELEEEVKRLADDLRTSERESKAALESLRVKFEAVEYQNSVMKNLKDEAERQAYEVPQLHAEIKRLEKEIENRENDMKSFNENRKAIFNNYEKEVTRLKEENERLRKDVLFANEVIAKNMTPLKTDKAEINRLRESVKKKDEEINRLKTEVESFKKPETESVKKREMEKPETRSVKNLEMEGSETGSVKKQEMEKPETESAKKLEMEKPETESAKKLEMEKPETESAKKLEMEKPETESVKKPEMSQTILEECSSRENSPFVNLKKRNKEGEEEGGRTKRGENNMEKLTKQVEDLSIQQQQQPEPKSTRKKVDLLEETIHPSTIKNENKGRRKGKKEKEKEERKTIEKEKESIPSKKRGKCYKKLFTDNDFDELNDLNASPLEEISRLRPRK